MCLDTVEKVTTKRKTGWKVVRRLPRKAKLDYTPQYGYDWRSKGYKTNEWVSSTTDRFIYSSATVVYQQVPRQ